MIYTFINFFIYIIKGDNELEFDAVIYVVIYSYPSGGGNVLVVFGLINVLPEGDIPSKDEYKSVSEKLF